MFYLQRRRDFILFLLLLTSVSGSKSASLNSITKENESLNEKKLIKRGHFDSESGYGPPIHISSDVLHLEEKPSLTVKEPSIIYQDGISHYLPGWNEISTGWQPLHQIFQNANHEHFPNINLEGGAFSLNAHEQHFDKNLNDAGLHTHIIGNSGNTYGHISFKLNDKIDTNGVIDTKEKYYIKSYG